MVDFISFQSFDITSRVIFLILGVILLISIFKFKQIVKYLIFGIITFVAGYLTKGVLG